MDTGGIGGGGVEDGFAGNGRAGGRDRHGGRGRHPLRSRRTGRNHAGRRGPGGDRCGRPAARSFSWSTRLTPTEQALDVMRSSRRIGIFLAMVGTSAEHGLGMGDLLQEIEPHLKAPDMGDDDGAELEAKEASDGL